MPYRYPRRTFRRGGRRSYRSVGRRAIQSRGARPRIGSFAPRLQSLKLKMNLLHQELTGAAAGDEQSLMYNLQRPMKAFNTGDSTNEGATVGNNWVLGWDAYGALFTKYIVTGVKVKGSIMGADSGASYSAALGVTSQVTGGAPATFTEAATAPLSRCMLIGHKTGDPVRFKQYVNLSTLMGQVVVKHDQFVQKWGSEDNPPAANDDLAGVFYLWFKQSNASAAPIFPAVNMTLTFYVRAVSVNPDAVGPAAAAALGELTKGSSQRASVGEDLESNYQAQSIRDADQGNLPQTYKALKRTQASLRI